MALTSIIPLLYLSPNTLRLLSLVGLGGRLLSFHRYRVGGFAERRSPIRLILYAPYLVGQQPLYISPLDLSSSRKNCQNKEF